MEKDLNKILQEIKYELNKLEIEEKENTLEKLNEKLDREISIYNRYSKKQFYIRLKYIILSSLTLGIYSYFKKNKVNEKIEELENYMTQAENEYNILNIEILGNQIINEMNKNTKEELLKNYNQINDFLSLMDNVDNEEKQRILNYKIGVSNE